MNADEQAIRTLIASWMEATKTGDLDRVLSMMDDDVVFLGAGRPAMRGKASFAQASRALERSGRFEGTVVVEEVRVFGDWAYCWNQIAVTITPDSGDPTRLAGPAMAILRKQPDGRWVIFRDANMLTPVA
ncbi:MAG TPA: SgcJ/EcaC family oxidoreductase [Vicinamibacterales bacterium]|nr:SgcJ/EcaC family oxidoreductase [Vicinamibacterales bacterium]